MFSAATNFAKRKVFACLKRMSVFREAERTRSTSPDRRKPAERLRAASSTCAWILVDAHPRSHEIFRVNCELAEHPAVLVNKAISARSPNSPLADFRCDLAVCDSLVCGSASADPRSIPASRA